MPVSFGSSNLNIYIGDNKIGKAYFGNDTIYETEFKGLCFTANTDGSTVKLNKYGSLYWTGSYSTDGITWTEYVPSTTGVITLTNAGDKLYFKGTATVNNMSNYIYFVMTGSIAASGNCMSMWYGDDFKKASAVPRSYAGFYLFKSCKSLTTAPELPATTLASYCYASMFYQCTALTASPVLPATILAERCYNNMFNGCTSLTKAPELPATELVNSCYSSMFSGCKSLTTPPELPATTLASSCYQSMFRTTSLTTAPELPATTLASYCYASMFMNCTSLYVSDTSGEGYNKAWTIPSSGIFTNTYAQSGMFSGCLGTRSSDDMTGASDTSYTYYTQNEPV